MPATIWRPFLRPLRGFCGLMRTRYSLRGSLLTCVLRKIFWLPKYDDTAPTNGATPLRRLESPLNFESSISAGIGNVERGAVAICHSPLVVIRPVNERVAVLPDILHAPLQRYHD